MLRDGYFQLNNLSSVDIGLVNIIDPMCGIADVIVYSAFRERFM